MRKNKILPLILSLFLLMGSALAVPTFGNLEPDDNWKTSDKTPQFCVTVSGADVGGYSNLTLYIDDVSEGNLTATYNNNITKACITSITTLNYTSYSWKLGVVEQVAGLETNSTARTITISRFGSVTQTLSDVTGLFAPMVAIVVAVVPLIIAVALIGFILGLVSGLFGDISGKIRKGF